MDIDRTSATFRTRLALGIGLCIGGWLTLPVLADPPAGYYDTVDTTSAAAMRTTLHEVIDDHQRFVYTTGTPNTWDILEPADEDPNNAGNILDVYKNASYVKEGGGNPFYQREHTWPSSYGFPSDNSQNYPFTDCHMLHLVDGSYNGSRGNTVYDTCSAACDERATDVNDGQGGGTGVYPGNSNWRTGTGSTGTWETWIGKRGNVARALLYMDVRYEGGTHGGTGASEPDLILTDNRTLIGDSNTGSNESIAYMGLLSVLLQWHLDDPVDQLERDRNDVVFGFQLNRNPFVDHPEWVACVFNDDCGCTLQSECDDGFFCNGLEDCVGGFCQAGSDPCPGQSCDEITETCFTTLDPWINELHYNDSGTDEGEFVEIAGPAGTVLTGWKVIGYNGSNGNTYSTQITLMGTLADQGGCLGVAGFDFIPMQNGAPDGLALVNPSGTVVEFISYEGSFLANDGPAAGMTSVDIGVDENPAVPEGQSLQLGGTGATGSDFTWQGPAGNTRGLPNAGQTFDACSSGCNTNGNCDDGLFCNGAETCDGQSTCQPGTSVDCDDGVACTDDSCNEGTDVCDNLVNDANCDDGLFCNGDETCDPVFDCQAGTAVDCDDLVGCTDDSCNEGTDQCDNIANDANCDDGLFCTGVETCDPELDCLAGSDPCAGQTCDEGTDTCSGGACNSDGVCDSGEDCNNCSADCISGGGAPGCGNGVCEDGEDCLSCPDDCNGKQNGKASNKFCCSGTPGGMGGTNPVDCGDDRCSEQGFSCGSAASYCCGDAVCEGAEDSSNCALDCGAGPVCGDAVCDPGEDQCNCPGDCGTPPATETNCTDGVDNDCNEGIDCADPDCGGDPACACGQKGDPCSSGADCCSGNCKNNGTCR